MVYRMRWKCAVLFAAVACASCGAFMPSADDLRKNPHGHLVWAARTGDIAAIQTLAASGIDLDESSVTPSTFVFPDLDHRDSTALQHAVRKHQVDAVRVLLEWGADPDVPRAAATPLFIAAALDEPAIVRLLLDAGADVDTASRLAQTEPGGPLWHFVERLFGAPSPTDVVARMRATAAPSRP